MKAALPPLDGVGTFVGSRSASVDTVLGKFAEDLDNYGFPNVCQLAQQASGDFNHKLCGSQLFNATSSGEGLLGGHLPIMRFIFPLQQHIQSHNYSRHYWEVIAAAVPDMKGSREQSVWFRFTEVACAVTTDARPIPPCNILSVSYTHLTLPTIYSV